MSEWWKVTEEHKQTVLDQIKKDLDAATPIVETMLQRTKRGDVVGIQIEVEFRHEAEAVGEDAEPSMGVRLNIQRLFRKLLHGR